MIAASEPQEFIPSGRQQVKNHPGLPKPSNEGIYDNYISDAVVVKRLERFSISEDQPSEWWLIRKSLENYSDFGKNKKKQPTQTDKNNISFLENSYSSWKTVDPNSILKSRLSDFSPKLNQILNQSNSKDSRSANSSRSSKSRLSLNNTSNISKKPINDSKNLPETKNVLASMEEELYINNCTAIWSKGILSQPNGTPFGMQRVTLCSYSMETPIKFACWCNFYLEWPSFIDEEIWSKSNEPIGEPIPSTCLIDSNSIFVFTQKGEDFRSNLPFPVEGLWETKYGVVIEKKVGSVVNQPFLFSLSHPLNDFAPITIKTNSNITKILTKPLKIIFTSCEPSIFFCYDPTSNSHSIYLYRRLTFGEFSDISVSKSRFTNSIYTTDSPSQRVKQMLSLWSGHGNGTGLPLQMSSKPSGNSDALLALSPVSYLSPSRAPSPMAQISRCQSPCSSSVGSGNTSWSYSQKSSLAHGTTAGETNFDYDNGEANPEHCLELIWSEKSNTSQTNSQIAKMAFLSTDIVGQRYLCYLIPSKTQLYLVRMDVTNENSLIFGHSNVIVIVAKDASPIPDLNMIAILDASNHVILYSGPQKIGKVHVGGVSAELTASPLITNYFKSKSPFPRRSSLLPNANITPVKFDEHQLSPVAPLPNKLFHSTMFGEPLLAGENSLVALSDALGDRLTLKYLDGTFYRISLPKISTGPLVTDCLNALRISLPKDVACNLICKWYAVRNAPGPTDLTNEEEFGIFVNLLLGMMGYDVEGLNNGGGERSTTPDEAKKQRPSPQGSLSDWEFLANEKRVGEISKLLNLKGVGVNVVPKGGNTQINSGGELFSYFRYILFALHLLYEELKLNLTRSSECEVLVPFLHRLATDLRLRGYVVHYWSDFPQLCKFDVESDASNIVSNDLSKIGQVSVMTEEPPNVFKHIFSFFFDSNPYPFPYIRHINCRTKIFVQICGYVLLKIDDIDSLIKNVPLPGSRFENDKINFVNNSSNWSFTERAVYLMTLLNLKRRDLDNFPPSINFIFHEILWQCRESPPTDWPSEAFFLIQRPDLAVQCNNNNNNSSNSIVSNKRGYEKNSNINNNGIKHIESDLDDGMDDIETSILRLRFPDDRRVHEVRKLLQSSEPVEIKVVQRPEVSDHEFIEEQEKHLYAVCTRTMALSVGRGMFTLRTATPVVTEPLPVPKLNLTGKAPPRGATVELTHIDTPANMNTWPLFHNGVAAGLRINSDASDIDSTWIEFNRPKSTAETSQEHAGFLMALGLNGHLKNLERFNTFEYLTKFYELTSVGLLIGLSAMHRGTMDTVCTKMLGVHIEALLPPTSMELDIPQNLQAAALLGIGLVYQGSAHRHMTEVLLTEIGRPPGPEMENSVDRESYALAAGLALGLVTLGCGGQPCGMSDLAVTDTLHHYMCGGNKRPFTGPQCDKYRVPSFQIREGSQVNLDVTAPGSTLALGLMYIKSGNKAVADWMKPPETLCMFDFVRPDFLMLRIVSRSLILWDEVKTNIEWVESQVPNAIKKYCLIKPANDDDFDIDYEAVNQAYCNIVAGACFALGLKYAGTANEEVFRTLYHYCRMFMSLTVKSIAELAGKPTIETCLNVVLLSLSMVMAGTGRLEVLRICRHLRKRVGVTTSSVITYGSHLITHMALGLLFLGGGRYTLSNSPSAIAAMLCAFFPKFPTHSNDNRYHLQAFRHLYVLAVEPRLFVPKDVINSKICYSNISVISLDGIVNKFKAPCLLPDLSTLSKVSVEDERYWPVVFERGRNWDKLEQLLEENKFVEVKQRAGCLSYIEDPMGSRSLLAKVLTQSQNIPWVPSATSISSFSSENTIKLFTEDFLTSLNENKSGKEEALLKQMITTATYDCVTKDKMAILPMWIYFLKAIQNMKNSPSNSHLWQLKIFFATVSHFSKSRNTLISPEIITSMQQQILSLLDEWEVELTDHIKNYIFGENLTFSRNQNIQNRLACYLNFYDVPFDIFDKNLIENTNFLQVFDILSSKKLNSVTISKIIEILNR